MALAAIALRRQRVVRHGLQQLLAEGKPRMTTKIAVARSDLSRPAQASRNSRRTSRVGPLRHLQHRLANVGAGARVVVHVEEHLQAGEILGPGIVRRPHR